jgi:hypothetical protein
MVRLKLVDIEVKSHDTEHKFATEIKELEKK